MPVVAAVGDASERRVDVDVGIDAGSVVVHVDIADDAEVHDGEDGVAVGIVVAAGVVVAVEGVDGQVVVVVVVENSIHSVLQHRRHLQAST